MIVKIALTDQEKTDALEMYIRDAMSIDSMWKLIDSYPSMGEFTFELGTIEEVTQDEEGDD